MNMTGVEAVAKESGIKVVDPNVQQLQEAMKAGVVHDRIKEIQSKSLQTLIDRQDELIARLEKLSEIPDMAEAARQRAIIESDLNSVRAEYAKRQEDIGVLANSLFALYDELGLQAQTANQDGPQDIAKRQAAEQAVLDAQSNVGRMEAELEEAKGAWFGKDAKVATANDNLAAAQQKLQEAKDNIAVVEEQILVDKHDRVRKASIAQNIAMIREHTSKATAILSADIDKTTERIGSTKKALESAVQKNVATVRELDKITDEIEKCQRDLVRETKAMNDIPNKKSTAFAEQQQIVIDLQQAMTEKSGQQLKLNSTHMAMVQAIEANKSSLNTLMIQLDTAEVYHVKLTTAEKTAEVLGQNIDLMFKNMIQETANRSLDQVTDHMTLTAVELGTQIGAASMRGRNDAIDRHMIFMKGIKDIEAAGDAATAIELKRALEIDEKQRQGYADMGIDTNMSNLLGAIAATEKPAASAAKAGDVEY